MRSHGAGRSSLEAAGPACRWRSVSTFFWNVHWQCSVAAGGASAACKERAGRRFVELARSSKAEVVASVELSHGMSEPVSLISLGLVGWTQVNGSCAKGRGGDSAALAFAPGWAVQSSGGGCLRLDSDTRAFAVARVVPPSPVRGCPTLCFLAIHAPHSDIERGRDVVSNVCGDAASRCALGMGDWNTDVGGLERLWSALINGRAPTFAEPNERTCCWPESQHDGVFDHVASNIEGARSGGYYVHPYQILEEEPMQQHRPVSVRLLLPAAE